MTTIKGKKALEEVNKQKISTNIITQDENEITVEQYLEQQCDLIIKSFQDHSSLLISKLRQQYAEGVKSINLLAENTIPQNTKICVILKCIAGSHIGQRFRLESVDEDNVFKIGRSTGRLFKEKGVSIYKDKEVSTTHAKIELRNGQAFLIDMKSTNGTQLNNVDCEGFSVPYRLKNNDLICMGTTEFKVQISFGDDDENMSP